MIEMPGEKTPQFNEDSKFYQKLMSLPERYNSIRLGLQVLFCEIFMVSKVNIISVIKSLPHLLAYCRYNHHSFSFKNMFKLIS